MSNDRLKFRVWDKENETMVYVGDGDPYVFCIFEDSSLELRTYFDEAGYVPVDSEFMQWTGLYDSEGVEIYESDFVSLWYAPGSTAKGWIKFENGGFYFKTPEAYPNSCLAHDCVFEHGNSFRVTGNKFETQDIMERG